MNAARPLDSSSLVGRLLAPLHRTDDSQSGYRFVANIAAADLDRALQAVKMVAPGGEIRLVLIACSELGLPLKGAAVYVLNRLPEPESFWRMFHSLAAAPDAGAVGDG